MSDIYKAIELLKEEGYVTPFTMLKPGFAGSVLNINNTLCVYTLEEIPGFARFLPICWEDRHSVAGYSDSDARFYKGKDTLFCLGADCLMFKEEEENDGAKNS
jgi:hypothetical protein